MAIWAEFHYSWVYTFFAAAQHFCAIVLIIQETQSLDENHNHQNSSQLQIELQSVDNLHSCRRKLIVKGYSTR